MDSPIYVTPPTVRLPAAPAAGTEVADLLRQVLDVQREQLAVLRAQAAAQDAAARWRAFLARWHEEFPDVGTACKQVLPAVERAYLTLVKDLTDRVRDEDGGLDTDFALNEFLDRYGMRLGQLGAVLTQLGPLADAAPAEQQ